MKSKKCKNKKCKRILPEGYKHQYCENCRNNHAKYIKNSGQYALGLALLVVTFITRGKINPSGKI